MLLPALAAAKERQAILCISNLKQMASSA